MSIVCMQGFDDTVAESGSVAGNTTGRNGVANNAYNRGNNVYTQVAVHPELSDYYFGMGFKVGALANVNLVRVHASDATTAHFGWGITSVGAVTLYGPGLTVLATSAPGLIDPNVWYYVEMHAVVHNTTGSLELRLDEDVLLSYSGDTYGGSSVSGKYIFVRDNGNNSAQYDDLYVDDAGYQGDIVVKTLLPSGNGDSTQWLGSDGNSLDNYLLVDEANSSSADYVGAASAGLTDLYQMGDLPAGYTPLAIQTLAYFAKSDGGTPPVFKVVSKGDGGTELEDPALTPSTTYQSLPGPVRTTDPDGNALTLTNVNGIQVGVRSA